MGCKLVAVSVKPTGRSDWNLLAPKDIGVQFHEVCESTNTLASSAGSDGTGTPMWFVAGQQQAGRGRRGRAWTSEPGNFYGSYLFKPALKISELATLPFLVSLAVRDTFIGLGCNPNKVLCKWPNDVLISEKKASGILIESSAASGLTTDFIVVGIGLNLAHFPHDAQFGATSVAAATNNIPEVMSAFKILSHGLHDRLQNWQPEDAAGVIQEWRKFAWGIGMRREIRTNDETFHATLIGVNDDGGLSLRLDNGGSKQLYAGDVFAPPVGC